MLCLVEHTMSMKIKGSLIGFVCIKAELFKVIQSVWGINRASHTKKNGVKDDFLGLQALTKNLVLFFRGFLLVSRPCIFTVLKTSTRRISLMLTLSLRTLRTSLLCCLGCDTGTNEEWWAIWVFSRYVTKMTSGRLEVSPSLADKRASRTFWLEAS